MPCHVFSGSCSLCPYCDEERCPHYHDHDDDHKYYFIYQTDFKESYLILKKKVKTKAEVKAYVEAAANKKHAKKYLNSSVTDSTIEIVVSPHSECNWILENHLQVNLLTKQVTYLTDNEEGQRIQLPWKGKIANQ